mgnify:FL=1
MLKRTIPSSGEKIAAIGVGTWRGFDIGSKPSERAPRRSVLETLLGSEASVIDCSPMYGRSEEVVGDILADLARGQNAFIATKVWARGRSHGISQMKASFRLFRTDVIDPMQIHNLVDWRTQLATMRSWKNEGRFRYLGYTHYRPDAFDELMNAIRSEPIDFLQFCYSIIDRDAEKDILPFCQANGIATLINLPFGGGRLLSRLSQRPLPDLATELGCSNWAQYCLKYVISHPGVTCSIPGTSNPIHMADFVAASDGPMPEEPLRRKMVEAL